MANVALREMTKLNRELKVLHVEDDDMDTLILQRLFKQLHVPHHLTQVSNGQAAMELMRSGDEFIPDVILLDLNMPVMDGWTFLEELRKDPKLHKILVFVFSTSDNPPDIELAYSYHVGGYMVKPLTFSKFKSVVEHLLNLWSMYEFPEG